MLIYTSRKACYSLPLHTWGMRSPPPGPESSSAAGQPSPAPAQRCVMKVAWNCSGGNSATEEMCVHCSEAGIQEKERNVTVIQPATYFYKASAGGGKGGRAEKIILTFAVGLCKTVCQTHPKPSSWGTQGLNQQCNMSI